MLNEIEKTKRINKLKGKGGFISHDFLALCFTIERIEYRLRNFDLVSDQGHGMSDAGIENLAWNIKRYATKLYAILILIQKSTAIEGLLKRSSPIDDRSLFKSENPCCPSSFCSIQDLEKIFPDDDQLVTNFYRNQWVIPPQLSSRDDRILEFSPEYFRFPFTSERKSLGEGSAGEVYETQLPMGHLRSQMTQPHHPQFHDQRTHETIACKRIRPRSVNETEREKMKREVLVLRKRQHTNITPLLGSFFAGLDDISDQYNDFECLYLLSPRAMTSMEEWLYQPKDEFKVREDDLRRHIHVDAMLGLISGLTYIHREIDGRVGYHRDIKPKNLLLFQDCGSFTWKIADFGTSNLKLVDDTGTTNSTASSKWAPREFFTENDSANKRTHGRAHDVFSMGCVFLELATFLHWNGASDGLREFSSRRAEAVKRKDQEETPGGCDAFYKAPEAIQEWFHVLQNMTSWPTDCLILRLIAEMLAEEEDRLFSWEVEIDLFILTSEGCPSSKISERLGAIIQPSQVVKVRSEHNVYARAEKRESDELERNPRANKRDAEFFKILEQHRWRKYSPRATTEGFGRTAYSGVPLTNLLPADSRDQNFGGGGIVHIYLRRLWRTRSRRVIWRCRNWVSCSYTVTAELIRLLANLAMRIHMLANF